MQKHPSIICAIDSCQMQTLARGWCNIHYGRWYRHGNPLYQKPTMIERFWAKINKYGPIPTIRPELGPCWIWLAGKNRDGYGQFRPFANAGEQGAHRFAYEWLIGPVSEGLQLDHLCRVRHCVNPAHLEPVTCAINTQRGSNGNKTHCHKGHPFDKSNTRHRSDGRRSCRTCILINQRVRRAAKNNQ